MFLGPPLLADQGHEDACDRFTAIEASCSAAIHSREVLVTGRADRNDEPAARRELRLQCRGYCGRAGGHEDPVEGRHLGETLGAIADMDDEVGHPYVRRAFARSLRKRGVTFDREHHPGKPCQDGRLKTRAGSNLEDAMVRLRSQRFGHDRNHVGLRDGLAFPDCERVVFVRVVPQRLGDEEMPRHRAPWRQGPGHPGHRARRIWRSTMAFRAAAKSTSKCRAPHADIIRFRRHGSSSSLTSTRGRSCSGRMPPEWRASSRELRERSELVKQGGGARYLERHRAQGKLPARERIEKLLDEGSPFLELSALAAWDLYDDDAPSAGIVTGIGRVSGRDVMIVANDATVKGGTYYPITVKKHVRAQQVALENRLPCVYLVDSGGAFLPLQAEVFPDRDHFGRIFYNQARLSAERIPQIAVVMGSCTAGGAYVPAMSDETVIVKGTGTIFLGGPPLVKAATGEEVTAEELGGADVHTRLSGVADYLAEDDEHALQIARTIVSTLNTVKLLPADVTAPEEPRYDPREIYGIVNADTRKPYEVREIIARLVDGSRFDEFKERYGATLVTGFARLHGFLVGHHREQRRAVLRVRAQGHALHRVVQPARRPADLPAEHHRLHGRPASTSAAASRRTARRWSTPSPTPSVPKFTVVIGGSFGAGNYGMCGRAFEPRLLWMWPNARISVMGGEQAAGVLTTVKRDQLARDGRTLSAGGRRSDPRAILEKYEREGSPYYSTARLWDDGILDPADTRSALALGLGGGVQCADPRVEVRNFPDVATRPRGFDSHAFHPHR